MQGEARSVLDGAREAGVEEARLQFAASSAEAGEILGANVRSGDVVLIKGSRGVKLEQALSALRTYFLERGGVMLYHLLYEFLYPFGAYWSPLKVFNVVQYVTFRTAAATLTALLISLLLGPWLIRRLQEFQIGQHIREEGPKSHKAKAGTPTMGGVLILVSIVLPTLLWANLRNPFVWLVVARRR